MSLEFRFDDWCSFLHLTNSCRKVRQSLWSHGFLDLKKKSVDAKRTSSCKNKRSLLRENCLGFIEMLIV